MQLHRMVISVFVITRVAGRVEQMNLSVIKTAQGMTRPRNVGVTSGIAYISQVHLKIQSVSKEMHI